MLTDFATFALIALLLTITPGVDIVLVLRNSVARGTAGGLASAIGICSGLLLHALLSSVGLTVILAQSAGAYHAVRVAGAIYLVWLGLRTLYAGIARRELSPGVDADSSATPASGARPARGCLAEGFATNLLNPKVVLFYLAVVPQFVSEGSSLVATSLLLGSTHAALGLAWLGLIAMAASRARVWFERPNVSAWLDRCAGTVLIAFGLRVAAGD